MLSYEPVRTTVAEEHELHASSPSRRRPLSSFLIPPRVLDKIKHFADPDCADDDSLDDEDEKNRLRGDVEASYSSANSFTSRRRTRYAIPLALLLLFIGLGAFQISNKVFTEKNVYHGSGLKPLTMDAVFDSTFYAKSEDVVWLKEAGEGVYSYQEYDGSIYLKDLKTNSTKQLVAGNSVKDDHGNRLAYGKWSVSSDLRYILFQTNRKQQWRHSSFSNYYVYDLQTAVAKELHKGANSDRIAIAQWAPKGHAIAYVVENDVYVLDNPSADKAIRVTNSGSSTVFNGVCDWIYEEEVFSSDSALWWSPSGTAFVYLTSDETEVPVYDFPIYNESPYSPGAEPYPSKVEMKYPKPGYPNPNVTAHLFDLATYNKQDDVESAKWDLVFGEDFDAHDRIISEVAWVDDDDIIIKQTNRVATREKVAYFNISSLAAQKTTLQGNVVRDTDYVKLDGGWTEAGQTIVTLSGSTDIAQGYLDVIPSPEGYLHIALFTPYNSKTPIFLTHGEFDVDFPISSVDTARRLVYFKAAKPSVERHIFSVPIPTSAEAERMKTTKEKSDMVPLTDTSSTGFYSVNFSPRSSYYTLRQDAGLPYSKLFKLDNGKSELLQDLELNGYLNNTLQLYQAPIRRFFQIPAGGEMINAVEIRPAFMDESGATKYPVLLRPYGGPGSQSVQHKFEMGWSQYLAQTLNYVVVIVDGRGTGFRGRKFKTAVRKQLGLLERDDQITAAKYYAELPWVDKKRIGIQGWSFGGFLSAKVAEANDPIISLAMSVAPVTDWKYYDTIYTERYMETPTLNPSGYSQTAITRMEGFENVDFLLAHGSADDNVHFSNSAALLDRLTLARVRGFRFRMFTDSAHSISKRGAFREVHEFMTDFLIEKWGKVSVRKKWHI